jgi:hypothetical protein
MILDYGMCMYHASLLINWYQKLEIHQESEFLRYTSRRVRRRLVFEQIFRFFGNIVRYSLVSERIFYIFQYWVCYREQ